jgi:hypothetical protein
MAFDILTSTTFETETCCSCGVVFAMTREFKQKRLENRGQNNPFYCPNGHKQWYIGKTEAQKLQEENERLRRIADRAQDLSAAAERRAAAARGQVTKIRNRVGHGVCPCCTRSFQNLARHMSTEHPTFTAEAAE